MAEMERIRVPESINTACAHLGTFPYNTINNLVCFYYGKLYPYKSKVNSVMKTHASLHAFTHLVLVFFNLSPLTPSHHWIVLKQIPYHFTYKYLRLSAKHNDFWQIRKIHKVN